jgi:acetyl esterase/lipase
MSDPLVLPIRSPKLLARFPPTLLLSSTRDQAMSSVIYTHAQLTGVGVEAELHLWDGLPHAFFVNNPQWPESKEAWQLVARFFDRRLGRKSAG